MKTVLRLTRHAMGENQVAVLRHYFGEDVNIVTRDIEYGSDPLATIRAAIDTAGPNVVALDLVAPMPVVAKVLKPLQDDGITVIQACFLNGPDGRRVVLGKDENGRPIFEFTHYDKVLRVVIETSML